MASILASPIKEPTPAERQLIEQFEAQQPDPSRSNAFGAFAKTGLPHRRMEAWKWTDFRQGLKQLQPADVPGAPEFGDLTSAIKISFDGYSWSWPDNLPSNVEIRELRQAGVPAELNNHPLGELTASLTGGTDQVSAVSVRVGDGLMPQILIDQRPDAVEASFARIRFVIDAGASVDVVERHAGAAGLSAYLFECDVKAGGLMKRTLLQAGISSQAVAITGAVTLAATARFEQTALAFGAGICRIETHVTYAGRDAAAELNSAYLPASGYHVDFTSVVTHGAEACTTRQLTKGAVSKGGRGVFQGKFLVPRSVGQYTDADMQHQALLLEEGAEVFAKPELEIYADDVECAHGNTSGQLDELALFYLRQRGIPLAEARALLTEAFVIEALEKASATVKETLVQAARDFLRSQV